ncbi:hypothetical protein L6452_16763 [Arctium lappa]|uniref:Uncharacterized protein n=1 Tax=Arctium lappa TaxID=4217 RepID=A0ACB9C1S1_ARCLA|nr:hypothetical protein L6452_16763 [Arctium lappa]
MGMIFGYFIGVYFPYISFTKISIHSSIHSPFDATMHEESKAHERSFPDNLGSSNTPELPEIHDCLDSLSFLYVIARISMEAGLFSRILKQPLSKKRI